MRSAYNYITRWTLAHAEKQKEDKSETSENSHEKLPRKANASSTTSVKNDGEQDDDAPQKNRRKDDSEDSRDYGADPEMLSLKEAEVEVEPAVRPRGRSHEAKKLPRLAHDIGESERPGVIHCHAGSKN